MMYGKLSLVKNNDDTYDLLISYSRHDAEFAMDFLSKPRVQQSYASVARFLQEFAKGLQIERAKIVAGSLVLAVMPLQIFLPMRAQRGMAYLGEGASVPQGGLAGVGTIFAGSLDLLRGMALQALGKQSEAAWEVWREWAAGGARGVRGRGPAASAREARDIPTPTDTLPQTACVRTPGAPMRAGADKQSRVLTTLQRGALVTLLGADGDWFQVQPISGAVGYVAVADLHVHKAAVVTPCAGAQVMAAPRSSAQMVATARCGEAVTLLEELEQGWCKVRSADKRVGYIRGRELARVSRDQPIVIKTAAAALKLRDAPSPTAGGRGVLPEGRQALVLEEPRDGYAKVACGDITAYSKGKK